MPEYRRAFVPGGTFFFTLVTARRRPILTTPAAREALRTALTDAARTRPFSLDAIVLLPDHLHCIWTLPPGDADFSTRWRVIKTMATRRYLAAGGSEARRGGSRLRHGERGVWQRRSWEHTNRDEAAFIGLCDYIHYNPVRHGCIRCPQLWPYSSFARFVREGRYEQGWNCTCERPRPPVILAMSKRSWANENGGASTTHPTGLARGRAFEPGARRPRQGPLRRRHRRGGFSRHLVESRRHGKPAWRSKIRPMENRMADIAGMIGKLTPDLIALRHEIHAHPELGYQEVETARRVLERIGQLPGMTIRKNVATTGIVATLDADKRGPCVALRADMDCLPITEETGKPYASKHPGRMHACGHDGHTTCLVGAATVLSQCREELRGPVKFIFQPAEEGGAGGRKMCEEGALENPQVTAAFALHGWPLMELGTVGCRHGASLASTNGFEINVHGEGAHAAYPHKGIDPVVIAAHIIVALQTIVSRNTDPVDSVVVTVGIMQAGTAVNIIPATALLRGTIRTLNPQTRIKAKERVKQVAERTAEAFGGRAVVNIAEGYPVTMNDRKATEFVARTAAEVLGASAVDSEVPPSLGGEDFAYYAERVPAAFWRLGVRPKGAASYPNLHQPTYDFPDDAVPIGVRMHCEVALRFAREW